MLDATESMESTLNGSVESLKILANQLIKDFPETIFRFGCICYRDPIDSPPDIHEYIGFTRDIGKIVNFLKGVRAWGGGDEPEDIAGAFAYALDRTKFHWKKDSSKAITLISDAPAHGKKYFGKSNYDAQGPLLDQALKDLADMDVSLVIISLNKGMESSKDAIIKTMCKAGSIVEWKDLAINPNEIPESSVINLKSEEEPPPFDPSLLISSSTHVSSLFQGKDDLFSSSPSRSTRGAINSPSSLNSSYGMPAELTQSYRRTPNFASPSQTPSPFVAMTNTQIIGAALVESSMGNIHRSQNGTR